MAEDEIKDNINIPVQRTDLIIFDDDIPSIKEMFIAEMKKMDEVMNKVSSDFKQLYEQSPNLYSENQSLSEAFEMQSSSKSQDTKKPIAHSPRAGEEEEGKILELKFDVSSFDPHEVSVKIENEKLTVSAAHKEKTNSSSILQKYCKEFNLPKGVDPSTINSWVSKDGVLTVQTPLPLRAMADKSDSIYKLLDSQ